jgi:UDP-3-O-[3-hydroxymyristoyl] glucosamine N-acyltransferase
VANIRELLNDIGVPYDHAGASDREDFVRVASTADADADCLVYVNKPGDGTLDLLRRSVYAVALAARPWGESVRRELDAIDRSVFLVDNPRLVVARILGRLFPNDDFVDSGVHPTALVHPGASIHATVAIGPYCVIGRCVIGEGSRVLSHTVIRDGVVIGKRVVVREHCCIGGVGFGFVRNEHGALERMPHVGTVVIEDDVELFPFTNVDRGTLGPTLIRRGTKIDHYAHISHNTSVGEDCVITAGTVLCGSSRLGSRTWMGIGAIVKEGTAVGDDVTVGLGAVVLRDVPDGLVVAGVPAVPLKGKGKTERA